MGFNFLDPGSENTRQRNDRHHVHGVVVAIVTNNQDTEGQYRVKLRFPWLSNGGESNSEESFWARISTFGAGKDRGMFCLPEVGDEVLVVFLHGDMQNPIVIGSVWNGVETTHLDNKKDGDQKGKNNKRTFKSRSGHILEFNDDDENKKESVTIKTKKGAVMTLDDTDGKEKIEGTTSDGNQHLLMDEKNKKITMESKNGDITISAPTGKVRIEAKSIETESSANTDMTVKGNWTSTVTGNMTLKSTGPGDIESTAPMTIKGAMVNIN